MDSLTETKGDYRTEMGENTSTKTSTRSQLSRLETHPTSKMHLWGREAFDMATCLIMHLSNESIPVELPSLHLRLIGLISVKNASLAKRIVDLYYQRIEECSESHERKSPTTLGSSASVGGRSIRHFRGIIPKEWVLEMIHSKTWIYQSFYHMHQWYVGLYPNHLDSIKMGAYRTRAHMDPDDIRRTFRTQCFRRKRVDEQFTRAT